MRCVFPTIPKLLIIVGLADFIDENADEKSRCTLHCMHSKCGLRVTGLLQPGQPDPRSQEYLNINVKLSKSDINIKGFTVEGQGRIWMGVRRGYRGGGGGIEGWG